MDGRTGLDARGESALRGNSIQQHHPIGTQTLIVHVIRTSKRPFLQSRGSGPLIAMTAVIMGIGVLIASTPLGGYLGFTPLPPLYWLLLVLTLLAYISLTQVVKTWLIRRAWI